MSRQASIIKKRQLELRERIWPNLNQKWLWIKAERKGYTSIPRTMPLICSMIDDLTPGHPASMVYLELWTRAFDEHFVSLAKSKEIAFHSGFTGQRAERTWKQRMKALHELGFINIQPGSSGPISYALILNPYLVIKSLYLIRKHPGVTKDKFNAVEERCLEISETSMRDDFPGDLILSLPAEAISTAVSEDLI